MNHISRIEWNTEMFQALELPLDRKTLLKSLVEAHDSGSDFDDFVPGKGRGLVISLFGFPGVGKTFSVEATSEHLRRPLYVVGGGDLGTHPRDVDKSLETVFDIATCWNAIVLIGEVRSSISASASTLANLKILKMLIRRTCLCGTGRRKACSTMPLRLYCTCTRVFRGRKR